MIHCVVCHAIGNFTCPCEKKIYCSQNCQALDFERHSLTCTILGKRNLQIERFSLDEQTYLQKFEKLLDRYGPTLKFIFTLRNERGEDVDRVLECLSVWMHKLIKFANDSNFISIVQKIPTSSYLRTLILSPFLNYDPRFVILSRRLAKMDFALAFIELLKYPRSQRTLSDMSIFWKWYNIQPQYIPMLQSNWSIVNIDENMLPIMKWGIQKAQNAIALPIARYQSSKTQGFYYHPTEKQNYTGTFFYFEIDSPAFLVTKSILVAPNKIYAAKLLNIPFEEVIEIAGFLIRKFEGYNLAVFQKAFPEYDLKTSIDLVRMFYDIPITSYRSDECMELWRSSEDSFDKPLWLYAIDNGVTTILLTHMVGTHRLVSEVFATQERHELFKNMYIVE